MNIGFKTSFTLPDVRCRSLFSANGLVASIAKIFRSVFVCIGLLCIWQLVVSVAQLPNYILPSPLNVFAALISEHQIILQHLIPTLIETCLGFVLGILFGCLAATSINFFKPLKQWFLPILLMSQAIPTFAIAPLLVIWLGYGLTSKIATTILMIFFPVASNFYDGLERTHIEYLNLAKTMNATRFRTFWHIKIPLALPSLASGIRIAAVIAPIGAIVGEWVGSSEGLGYLMLNANARMQIDMMFATLMVIIILSLTLYFIVDKLLSATIWWRA